jgi:hypothetical protein
MASCGLNFLDMKRPDGWAVSIEPLTFGHWKLAFYEPEHPMSSFLTLEGPGAALPFLASTAAEILLIGRPIDVKFLCNLSVADFVELVLPEHVPEEHRKDGWYRFKYREEYWRCAKSP